MKKNIEHTLYAINPIIDYEDFYLSYHRRKNPIFIQKENEFPKIKNISLKTEISTQDSKNDNDINSLIQTNSKINSLYNSVDTNKKNSLYYSSCSPFLKTDNICYPKINPIIGHIRNFISPNKAKIRKKNGKLSIKNLDIISLDTKTNLLVNEIFKKEKILENEIIETIYDPITKNKIINEIKNIDKNTNQQIDNIMKKTSKEVQVNTIRNFEFQPKFINLYAEEIFEEFNVKKKLRISNEINIEEKIKNKRKPKKNDKKEEQLKDIIFDFTKNNIRRKIELRNQYNQELSIDYIGALIRNELEKIKFILALYYYNSNQNYNGKFSNNKEEEYSLVIKDIKHKNYLNKSFNKFLKLNKYYDSLLNCDKRNRNKYLYDKNKYFFNTIDKSRIKNDRYNIDTEYINILMNQISNSSDEEENQNNKKNENDFNNQKGHNNSAIKQSSKDKSLFHIYNRNKISGYSKLTRLNQKNLNQNLFLKRKNLIPIKPKYSINDESKENIKKFEKKENDKLNEEKNIISEQKVDDKNKSNEISLKRSISEKNGVISINDRTIIDIIGESKNKNNYNDDIISNVKEEIHSVRNEKEKLKDKLIIYEEKEKYIVIEDKTEENNNINIFGTKNENNKRSIEIISDLNENNSREKAEGEKFNKKSEDNNKKIDKIEELKENNDNENHDKGKDISNISENNELVQSSDVVNDEDIEKIFIKKGDNDNIINEKQSQEYISQKKRNKKRKTHKLQTKKINRLKRSEKKLTSIINNPINYQYIEINDKEKNYHKEIVESIIKKKNFLVQKKNKNNRRKNIRNLKLNTITGKKKRVVSSHKGRNLLLSSIKSSYSLIKNFEIIKKKPRRLLSDGNIHVDESAIESNQVNIIKLQDIDIDKILNFVNEEEKRRLKKDKSATKIEKDIIEKPKDNIHSLFKEKKGENNKSENLTRDELVEKLKKDDLKMRQYIEGIIRSGLTIGNKKLNKQMKNNSILVYKDYNLGQFKFNRNFGIKDDFKFEPFRPLSGNENKEEENNEKEEKDTFEETLEKIS